MCWNKTKNSFKNLKLIIKILNSFKATAIQTKYVFKINSGRTGIINAIVSVDCNHFFIFIRIIRTNFVKDESQQRKMCS